MSYILPLAQENDSALVGGKARNLGVMLINGVPVPKGFVITCQALELFLSTNKLDLESCTHDDVIAGVFPEQLEAEITKQFDGIFASDSLVAVRSSGVSEDSSEHSFSGMYSSFLDTPRASLLTKIKECWASARNERVLEYKKNSVSSSPASSLMAVVVQEMVRSIVSGVVFTTHPVTNDDSFFVINAAPGLGEALVSGHITPDTYICNKDTGEIISQKLTSDAPCLPEPALSELLALARKIQAIFNHQGQDIEFAWDAKVVWAVQARPITTINKSVSANLDKKGDVCSNHETFDVFPEVITPLTWTTFNYIVHYSLQQRYKQKKIVFPHDRSMYELHWGRVYQNLTVSDMMVAAEFGFNPDLAGKAVKGELSKSNTEDADSTSIMEKIKGLGRLLTSLWDSSDSAVRMTQIINSNSVWCKEREKELTKMAPQDLTEEKINEMRKVATSKFCEFGCEYIDVNIRLQIFLAAVEVFLTNPAKALGAKPDFFIASLLTGLGGVFTYEMNEQLRRLADVAARDDVVMTFLRKRENWKNFREELKGTDFLQDLSQLLEDYGYRAMNELEAASVRWGEDPSYIFDQILTMVKLKREEGREAPGAAEGKRKITEDILLGQVPFLQRYLTRWAINKLQEFTRLRENSKCVLVQFIALARSYLVRAAQSFASRGLIEHRDDVFYLTLPDLDELFAEKGDGKGDEYKERARKNKEQFEKQRKWMVVPDMFVGGAPHFSPKPTSDDKDILKGVGASCGVTQGTARLLASPNERDKLTSKDDILVCATTDPAWTPLFACCAGLVCVHGGILSHGAIVAREFGIPAVLGVSNALEIIKDGMQIQVNGNDGTVTILAID